MATAMATILNTGLKHVPFTSTTYNCNGSDKSLPVQEILKIDFQNGLHDSHVVYWMDMIFAIFHLLV